MKRTGVATVLSVLTSVVLATGPVAADPASPPPPVARAQATTAKPSITRLTPDTGSTVGGGTVVIKGRQLTEVKRVLFGSSQATVVKAKSAKTLVVVAPAHAAGAVSVRVITKHGSSKKSGGPTFTYVTPAPALSRVAPSAGPTSGGTSVALTGSDFTGATAVHFGSANASFRIDSATRITATSPAHAAAAVDVTVTTPGGSTVLAEGFTYTPAPTLSFVDPGSGPMAGTTVTLVGSNFTSATAVAFGGTAARDVLVAPTGAELTATTPAHAAGWVDVTVSTAGGSTTLTHGYLYVGGIALTGVAPAVGPANGGSQVTLTGSGLTDDTLVTFGNKPSLAVDANSAGTSMTALLPSHPSGAVDVEVSNQGDSATLLNAFTFVDAPTLASVVPTAGPMTGGSTVTLTGTGFRAGMQVSFGGTSAPGVTVVSGSQATATAPSHAAGAVDVSVTTPGGSASLTGGYTYVVAPTLASLTPVAGPLAGGTTVALTGSGFRAGMQVTFGGIAGTGVSVTSATDATVTTPGHAMGTVSVVVTTPGGASTPLVGAFTYTVAPTLASLTPVAGPLAGGTTVALTGSGFRAGMQVTFGGIAGTGVNVTSATQATVTSPDHAAGAVNVVVATPGGTSPPVVDGFTYVVAPVLSTVAPPSGATTGGTTVALTGSGFRAGIQVSLGGAPAMVVSVSPGGTQLTALTPAHAAGAVSVSVSTPGGSDTLGNAYAYVEPPTLTAVAPDAGPIGGGTTVTLTGSGFGVGTQVLFGTTPAAGVSVNPDGTELTAVTPPHAAGAVNLSVTTPGGSATLPSGFAFLAVPTLTSLTPDAGPVGGGRAVTLTGSGFRAGMTVSFGGGLATGVSVSSSSSATAVVPAHTAGAVDVSIATPGGAVTLGNSFTYLVAPTVTSVSPADGPAAGGTTVTVTGTGFRAGMQVAFGGTPAAVASVTGTHVTVTTPGHSAGAVTVAVTTPGGTDGLPTAYTYLAAPTLDTVNPTAGPSAGGATVTLSGTGLTGTSDVTFDGVPATAVLVVDDTTVTVTTPAHAPGTVDVVVTTPGGSATLSGGYTYVDPPTITSLSPSSGPSAGGTAVTLDGTDLATTTAVTFDGVAVTSLGVGGAGQLVVQTPAHLPGDVDIVVTTAGGSATVVAGFAYLP